MGYFTWLILAACLGLIWPNPGLGDVLFASVEKKLAGFATNRAASYLGIGFFAILVRVLLLEWIPVPRPWLHDEYSYLFAADTIAHGRLANPTHPLYIFFDTFHILQHPTYSSIYPPMQGAVLAVGKLLGHPWIGVLLSTAAMCAAMTWMLQGWMPARWAFLGGTLVFLQLGIYTYWINSYWGGSVPATGAALVMGAYSRIIKNWRLQNGIPFGLGIAILALSRPVEGFIYCVPVAAALLWRYFHQRDQAEKTKIQRMILTLTSIGVCVMGLVLYCNLQVTKNPLLFPTALEVRENVISPVFVWEHMKPPRAYPNPQFGSFYTSLLPSEFSSGLSGIKAVSWEKVATFWEFFIGPSLSFPLLALPWLFRDRKMRLVLVQFGLSAAGLFAVVWFHPHYAAPLTVNVALLGLQGLRHIRTWRLWGRPIGVSFVRLTVLINLLIVPVNLLFFRYPQLSEYWTTPGEWSLPFYILELVVVCLAILLWVFRRGSVNRSPAMGSAISFIEVILLLLAVWPVCIGLKNKKPSDLAAQLSPRFAIEQQFEKLPGEHLVIVRYAPKHNAHEEFVYNDADIDHAKTVWAREIPGLDLNPLLSYFRNRDVWIVEPDEVPIRLYPYLPQNSAFLKLPAPSPEAVKYH